MYIIVVWYLSFNSPINEVGAAVRSLVNVEVLVLFSPFKDMLPGIFPPFCSDTTELVDNLNKKWLIG